MRSTTASTTSSASSTSTAVSRRSGRAMPTGSSRSQGERTAFESLMDLLMARLEADPSMHVYHYAPYEPTALKRLMGRYGTREAEVDRLLREGVLVDLLRGVRQSLRASVESYSIKKMEAFYDFEREVDLRDAGSSVVAFETWLELGEGERPETDILERIERYNRDDVVSNQRLRDWLEQRRDELIATGIDVPRPAPRETPLPEDVTETQARVEALAARLIDPDYVPGDGDERPTDVHARWLLAQLLSWHRREDKAMWWDFHRLMDLTPEQLVDESDPIGLLEPVAALDEEVKGKQTWRYAFPPQDFDLTREVYDPAQKQARPDDSPFRWDVGEVVAHDIASGTVDIRRDIEQAASAGDRSAAVGPGQGAPGTADRDRRVGRRARDRRARAAPRDPRPPPRRCRHARASRLVSPSPGRTSRTSRPPDGW